MTRVTESRHTLERRNPADSPSTPAPHATSGACEPCPLRTFAVLQHLSPGDWREFHRSRVSNVYRRGNAIFYEGNLPLGLYFVCTGRVKLVKDDIHGRNQIVRVVEAPDLLGDRAFFSEHLYACMAEAMEESRICFLEKRLVWLLLAKNPDTLRALLKRFAYQLGRAETYMHCIAVCTIRGRVAEHLLREWNGAGGTAAAANEFDLAESRTELAELLGTTPEAISRTLAKFRSEGWVKIEGRKVRILNGDRLRRISCLPEAYQRPSNS